MALGVALEDILIKAPTEAAAFAAGLAIHPALAPFIQDLENLTWSAHPDKRLDLVLAAEVAAEDVDSYDEMEREVSFSGFDSSRFKWAYGVTLNAPGMGELLTALRRDTIQPADFTHGLRKAKLETRWDAALADLANVYLSPDILAVMLQRSVIPNQGQLPGVDLVTTGKVPRFPQVELDAYKLAGFAGWSKAQLDAQTRIQGLPPGMELVARGVFRNIFDRGDFNLAAEQSNRRVEWADLEFDAYRQIPSAVDYVNAQIRGWRTRDEMHAGAALHGMAPADADLLQLIHGRPPTTHQAFLGFTRGGRVEGQTWDERETFRRAVIQSDIRPEWEPILWAQRYSYPSAFVLRGLTQAGDLTQAETHQILLYEGWEPALAETVSTRWAEPAAAKADPWLAKADQQLWTKLHKTYVGGVLDPALVAADFDLIGVHPDARPEILARWDAEKAL